MEELVEIREVTNKEGWEQFIAEHAPQSLFQSWHWGEAIKKIQNPLRLRSGPAKSKIQNSIWRLGVFDADALIGIAQTVKIQAKRGTILHIRHGPILKEWKKEYFQYVLHHLKNLAREQKAVVLRVSPLIENSQSNIKFFKSFGFIDAPIHQMDGEYCWVLDIDKPDEVLLSNMRKTTRYLIRQAEKMGVRIEKSANASDLYEFLALYKTTAQRQKFVPHRGIQEEFEALRKNGQIVLFKGYFEKKLLSGALILFYNNQAIYHHSASIAQKIPVNYLLQWKAIQEAKKRGMNIYNFWGVAPVENNRHPWQGLSHFKKGFGGRLVEYLHVKDLPLSSLYCATYSIEVIRKLWKGY